MGCKVCKVCKVDDPIEASSVHGFGGIGGLIAVALFDNVDGLLYGGSFKFFAF